MIELQVDGLKELQAALNTLADEVQAKIVRGALGAAGRVYRDAARQRLGSSAKKRTGHLLASIRVGSTMRGGVPVATVKAGSREAWYAHLIEYGAAAHEIKPKTRKSLVLAGLMRETVHHPGISARPFMRPAFDASSAAAVDAYAAYIRRRLERLQVQAGRVVLPQG